MTPSASASSEAAAEAFGIAQVFDNRRRLVQSPDIDVRDYGGFLDMEFTEAVFRSRQTGQVAALPPVSP